MNDSVVQISRAPDHSVLVFILAGGSGERFWPWSRTCLPKHLLRLFTDKTLLEETYELLSLSLPSAQIRILTNHQQMESIRKHCPRLPPECILCEPAKRDTASAAALATAIALRDGGPERIVILTPADSLIHPQEKYAKDIQHLLKNASVYDGIHTIGIPPTYPCTNYGYLELGRQLDENTFVIDKFIEKPDLKHAQLFCSSRRYLWNAGIFAWQAGTFLRESQRQQPAIASFIEHFPKDTAHQQEYLQRYFSQLPKISVDYAICENAASVFTIRASFAWDDLGTWDALSRHLGQDACKNTVVGNCLLQETTNTIAASQGRLIATVGVDNLIIVEAADALLVARRDKIDELKQLVSKIPPQFK